MAGTLSIAARVLKGASSCIGLRGRRARDVQRRLHTIVRSGSPSMIVAIAAVIAHRGKPGWDLGLQVRR